MAVDIGKLVSEAKSETSIDELSGKTIAIDAFNTIYQFLSIIRQPDGTPLTDKDNRITSHLSGLLYRTSRLIEKGVKPIFVFDGIPPTAKRKTLEARMSRRRVALEAWEKSKSEGLLEEARMHAMASTSINAYVISSSKELLKLMGVPFIQAPGEGEAQAAQLSKAGIAYASASQDYDSFLFGADVVIRNLTLTGRRKLPKKNVYVDVSIERIELKKLLGKFGITLNQLIWLGMLVGTDFNQGVSKVGPKTALKIASSCSSLDEVVSFVREKYGYSFETDPREVEHIFTNPDVEEISPARFSEICSSFSIDKAGLISFMCDKHGFIEERVSRIADMLSSESASRKQKGINSWL